MKTIIFLTLLVSSSALGADMPQDWTASTGARSISVTMKRIKIVKPIPKPRPVIQSGRPAGVP